MGAGGASCVEGAFVIASFIGVRAAAAVEDAEAPRFEGVREDSAAQAALA